jgi:acetyl esterase/lipase
MYVFQRSLLPLISFYLQTFKAMRGEPLKLGGTIKELRVLLSERKKALTTTQSNDTKRVIEEDITIPARDGYSIAARIYTPESPPAEGSPLLMMLHGGGFCLGGLENEELNCRNFAQQLGCVCVNVDYRLAPEHPFPIPVHDCWDALKWVRMHLIPQILMLLPSFFFSITDCLDQVATNAASLKADPARGFIVGGVSAGGNLAAVVGLLARDGKLSPPLTGLYLCIPVLLSPEAVPEKYKPLFRSYEQNKDAPILPKSAMDLFMGMHLLSCCLKTLCCSPLNESASARKRVRSVSTQHSTLTTAHKITTNPTTYPTSLTSSPTRKARVDYHQSTSKSAAWIPCATRL